MRVYLKFTFMAIFEIQGIKKVGEENKYATKIAFVSN